MITAEITKSNKPEKRLKVIVKKDNKKKTIHFGEGKPKKTGAYPDHKNEDIKNAWEARHRVRENWRDPMTAGFWSKWVLWNKKTIKDSIKDTGKKFNIKIK